MTLRTLPPRENTYVEERRRLSLNIKPPIFDRDKESRPLQVSKASKDYVKTMEVRDNEILTLFRTCLRDVAQSWLHLMDDKIENMSDFKKHFRDRFWNELIQNQMRSRFDYKIRP